MEYYCPEKKCSFDNNKPYVYKIPECACMDEHNIAMIYCPHCLSKMEKVIKINQFKYPEEIGTNISGGRE